jgi:hypothetical protein
VAIHQGGDDATVEHAFVAGMLRLRVEMGDSFLSVIAPGTLYVKTVRVVAAAPPAIRSGI